MREKMKEMKYIFSIRAISGLTSMTLGMLVLIFICLKIWAVQMPNINWNIALSGFSPIDWVNHLNLPENFIRDFPQGSQTYGASLFMYVYRLADLLFGISPEKLIPYIILFEILFMAFSSVIFFRALIPNALPFAPFIFALLVINSGARSMELAGFGGPFFWGLYYNFADGTRLIAIAMVLRGRFLTSALLFAVSVMTHPLIGVMGGIFALVFIVSDKKRVNYNKIFVSLVLFLLLAGGWWIYQLQAVDVSSADIQPDIWISFSKAFNYHFYPVNNGLLTFAFERKLLPFLSLLLLAFFYIFRIHLSHGLRNRILLGSCLLLTVTLAGLAISYFSSNPAFIKLTLTRASDMLILVCLAIVVAGLSSSLQKGQFFETAVASGLLLSPVLGPPFPVLYVFLAIISNMPILKRESLNAYDVINLVLLILFGIFIFIYFKLGYIHADFESVYLGHKNLWLLTIYIGCGVFVANLLQPVSVKFRKLCVMIVLLLVVSKTLSWQGTVNHGLSDKPLGEAFLSAQLWAKQNTDPTALFMVDPTIYYGWRDFSQRSSFGNLREWLHTSWLYDSKKSNYDEGLKRSFEFGYTSPAHLDLTPPLNGFDKISKIVFENFYSYDESKFLNLSKKYQINYLVMKKDQTRVRLNFPVAYENIFFIIYKI